MIRLTRSRRRVAAVASTALAAGALAVLPAVAGLSTASAAPVQKVLNYTCTVSGFGAPAPYASTLDLKVTPASDTTVGETFDAAIEYTLSMGAVATGPVSKVEGTVDLAFAVGGQTTTVKVPATTWSNPPGGNFTFTGKVTGALAAPATLGANDITLSTVRLSSTATAMGTNVPFNVPCTAAPAQDLKFGSVNVDATPAGAKYECTFMAWKFPAYLATTAALAAVNEDTAANPALTATLNLGHYWSNMSRSTGVEYKDVTGTLATTTSGKPGNGTLTFANPAVPATGAMSWAGTGSYGALDTANPGTLALSYGNLTLKAKVKNNFTSGAFVDAEMPCTLAPATQNTALGNVTVNDVVEQQPPAPVTDVKVTGVAKIKGVAKVGKKLTAVPGKAAGAKITYKWFSNGKAIKKATAKTLKLTKKLKGKKVTVKVTYTKTGFNPVTQTAKAVKVKK